MVPSLLQQAIFQHSESNPRHQCLRCVTALVCLDNLLSQIWALISLWAATAVRTIWCYHTRVVEDRNCAQSCAWLEWKLMKSIIHDNEWRGVCASYCSQQALINFSSTLSPRKPITLSIPSPWTQNYWTDLRDLSVEDSKLTRILHSAHRSIDIYY